MEALPHPPESSIMLVSDGGSENVNVSVSDYLASVQLKLHIAQVDVSFSNSMIEAVNKILKYRYIFRKDIPSFHSLDQVVKDSVADYNARPHYALHGLSPDRERMLNIKNKQSIVKEHQPVSRTSNRKGPVSYKRHFTVGCT